MVADDGRIPDDGRRIKEDPDAIGIGQARTPDGCTFNQHMANGVAVHIAVTYQIWQPRRYLGDADHVVKIVPKVPAMDLPDRVRNLNSNIREHTALCPELTIDDIEGADIPQSESIAALNPPEEDILHMKGPLGNLHPSI